MEALSGILTSMNTGAGALKVYSTGVQVAAHNIANVSTSGFTPQRALYATGPNGRGVELDAVLPAPRPSAEKNGQQTNKENSGSSDIISKDCGTDVAYELVHLTVNQRAFDANAMTIRTADEMSATLLDLKI